MRGLTYYRYSNVLLASLNSRAILSARHGGYIDVSASQTRSVLWSDMTSTLAGSRAAKSAPATINVQTTKIVHQDTELDDISKVLAPDFPSLLPTDPSQHNGTSSFSKPAATEFV